MVDDTRSKGGNETEGLRAEEEHLEVSSNGRSQWDFKQCAMWKVIDKNFVKTLSV